MFAWISRNPFSSSVTVAGCYLKWSCHFQLAAFSRIAQQTRFFEADLDIELIAFCKIDKDPLDFVFWGVFYVTNIYTKLHISHSENKRVSAL